MRCGRCRGECGRARLSGTCLVTLSCWRGHWSALLADILLFRQTHRRLLILRTCSRAFSANSSRRATPSRSPTSKTTRRAWAGNSSSSSPPSWEARLPPSRAASLPTNGFRPCGLRASATALRCVRRVAFGGGMLMAFGARLAGGCTSGHGISGTLQLNVASWISVICFLHRRHRCGHAPLQTVRRP